MLPVIYVNEVNYLQSCTTIAAKIAAIDAIIDALFAQSLVMAQQGEAVSEYQINDGQTIIKGIYRTPESILRTIEVLNKMRNTYANRGKRAVRMVDSKNFIARNC